MSFTVFRIWHCHDENWKRTSIKHFCNISIGLMAVLLLAIAFLCRLEINGMCAFRPRTARCVCVTLIDELGALKIPVFKSRCLRKSGRVKRWGSADFPVFFQHLFPTGNK